MIGKAAVSRGGRVICTSCEWTRCTRCSLLTAVSPGIILQGVCSTAIQIKSISMVNLHNFRTLLLCVENVLTLYINDFQNTMI